MAHTFPGVVIQMVDAGVTHAQRDEALQPFNTATVDEMQREDPRALRYWS